jgi:hypothetical protein
MDNSSVTSVSGYRYGLASFVSSLMTIFAIEFAEFITIPYVYITTVTIIYVLPALLVVDLVVYAVLARCSGTLGQIGRGILIGSLAVPMSAVVFTAGYVAIRVIGQI